MINVNLDIKNKVKETTKGMLLEIGEYDNIDQLMAENKLENIIIENQKLNKDLGGNENEQTSSNTTNETRSYEIKDTTNTN